jgi:hypothetical protein
MLYDDRTRLRITIFDEPLLMLEHYQHSIFSGTLIDRSKVDQGIWDSIIVALVNHIVDAAIASLTITGAHAKVVDFSHPLIHAGISPMVQKSQEQTMVNGYVRLSVKTRIDNLL